MMSNTYFQAKKHALAVFKKASQSCSAYGDFLEKIRSTKNDPYDNEFDNIPISDKKNYYTVYPLSEKLYQDKEISDYYMICTSSGSTGEPTIWPRDYQTDQELEKLHTQLLDMHFQVTKKKTLIVISFGLGSNTAGMLHAKLSWESTPKRKISVITPGIEAEKTAWLIEQLYKNYDQVVCIGYPPFISEFVDLGIEKKYNVKGWNLKILFTSESVSTSWRDQMVKKIHQNADPTCIASFYACTEAGIIGIETPETGRIINQCLSHSKLREQLFQSQHLPSLVEVNFLRKFVEIVQGEIVITIDQSAPLIRYNLHDRGMLLTTQHIKDVFTSFGLVPPAIEEDKTFLVVYGKNETSFGKQVFFIEDIKYALDEINFFKYGVREFQFNEKTINNKLNLTLQLYIKKETRLSTEIKKALRVKIKQILLDIKSQQTSSDSLDFQLKLIYKTEHDRMGYKSGKLRYFLS